MTTTASSHSLSVFTNSCRSTPRNPTTRLPSDRLDQYKSSCTNRHTDGEVLPVTTYGATVQGRTALLTTTGRPSTAPAAAKRPQHGEDGGVDLSYSTLFTTLLESNALLRDEIQQLRQEHRTTMSTLELLHVRQRVPLQAQASSDVGENERDVEPHSLRETDGNFRRQVSRPPAGEYRLSNTFPAQPLKDPWMLPQESGPVYGHSTPLRPQAQQEREFHSIGSTQEENNNGTAHSSPAPSISDHDEEQLEEVGSEQSDGAYSGSLSDSSAHSVHAASGGIVESSMVSLSGSNTSESEGGDQTTVNRDPFASPGLVAIESMWDDFSVEDYAPYEPDREEVKSHKEWTPRITIPKPFSMTLREEGMPKRKSRSLLIAERERMEREAMEDAERKKHFHASPVPATTFIPLYELINAKNQERRERVLTQSKEILQSTERPFSFMKREEERKRLKAEMLKLELDKSDEERQFQAKPVPKHLFDPQVNEQIREEEEYRRIRVKMRAEEMLAKSKLPGSMQVRGREYTDGARRRERLKQKQSRAFMTRDHRFHPQVNPKVPDYDKLYLDFQKELARRKKRNRTTTAEPFYLRTQLIPSRKEQVEQDLRHDDELLPETRWPYVAPRGKSSHKSVGTSNHFRSSSAPYPAQLTETAKIRQSLTREKLADAAERELANEQRRMDKRSQQRELQKAVSQKSLAYDPTAWLEDRKKLKLQELRRLDKERQEKYHQELQEMQERVESRPLLIEQPSLAAARRSAEAKYATALKKAGLSDEQIHTATTKH